MTADEASSFAHSVGRLEGVVATMAKNAEDDREYLRDGFKRIHERLDEHSKDLSSIKFGVEVSAAVDAQVRTELDAVKNDLGPLISRDKMLRLALGVVAGAAAAGGLTVAVAADTVRGAVRSFLGL